MLNPVETTFLQHTYDIPWLLLVFTHVLAINTVWWLRYPRVSTSRWHLAASPAKTFPGSHQHQNSTWGADKFIFPLCLIHLAYRWRWTWAVCMRLLSSFPGSRASSVPISNLSRPTHGPGSLHFGHQVKLFGSEVWRIGPSNFHPIFRFNSVPLTDSVAVLVPSPVAAVVARRQPSRRCAFRLQHSTNFHSIHSCARTPNIPLRPN